MLYPRFIVLIIEHATCHKPQAETNDYQELIIVSEAASSNREDPYHMTADVIFAIRKVWYIISCIVWPHYLLIDDEIVTMCICMWTMSFNCSFIGSTR